MGRVGPQRVMSFLQKPTPSASGMPLAADLIQSDHHFRDVPGADLSRCGKLSRLYSITWSAVASSIDGIVTPSDLAVLLLMTS